jgi:predicted metal-dependent phosphoesterase TrpH
MEPYVDLHVHTDYSDGSLSPRDVVQRAKEAGFKAIAIADHDEVGGVTEAIWAGHSHDLEIVPAVELTSGCDGKEIHLLGYFVDHHNQSLRENLKHFRYERFKRMEKMIVILRELGLKINLEAVRRIAGHGSLGRLHLARTLFKQNVVSTVQEAFDIYIGVGKPAYVEKPRLDVSEAITLITSTGGIPVLAHPKLARVDKSIPELVSLGIRGIEVFYTKHAPEDVDKYLAIASKYDLLVTGGSDCHGEIKDSMLLGSVKMPYRYLATLREHAAPRK